MPYSGFLNSTLAIFLLVNCPILSQMQMLRILQLHMKSLLGIVEVTCRSRNLSKIAFISTDKSTPLQQHDNNEHRSSCDSWIQRRVGSKLIVQVSPRVIPFHPRSLKFTPFQALALQVKDGTRNVLLTQNVDHRLGQSLEY